MTVHFTATSIGIPAAGLSLAICSASPAHSALMSPEAREALLFRPVALAGMVPPDADLPLRRSLPMPRRALVGQTAALIATKASAVFAAEDWLNYPSATGAGGEHDGHTFGR